MIERLYERLLTGGGRFRRLMVPRFRRLLRFMALPWLYATAIDWSDHGPSRLQAAKDMLTIFFRLGYFPDNYAPCRLWEKPRESWTTYYGSSYNPWARSRLQRSVQPPHLEAIFEDKEVATLLIRGADLPQPEPLGSLEPQQDFATLLEGIMTAAGRSAVMIKPVDGSAGRGVSRVERRGDGVVVISGRGDINPLEGYCPPGRVLIQAVVTPVTALQTFAPGALSTIRVVTMRSRSGRVLVLGATMRFGIGASVVDNWSAGGIAVGVDADSGRLLATGFDKKGHRYFEHPGTRYRFTDVVIPQWRGVLDLAVKCQNAFPFFRLFGVDVAVTEQGPCIIEINALPDIVFQEQTSGPLLRSPEILQAFAEDDLLFSEAQRRLLPE